MFTFVDIVEFLGAITRPRLSVFKSTKTGEADWSIVHVDTLVLTNQRRPLIFRVHVDNLLANQSSPVILNSMRTALRARQHRRFRRLYRNFAPVLPVLSKIAKSGPKSGAALPPKSATTYKKAPWKNH